jgi:hypothetical protein
MRTSVLVATVLAATLSISGASAATLINKDKVPHTLTVMQGNKSTAITLKAGEAKKGLCEKPCELSLGDSKLKIEKKTEAAWIQDGRLLMAK